MAEQINDGGAAFPTSDASGPINDGMSLRDWFAGQAMIGILGSRHGFLVDVGTDNVPSWAYSVADKMLAARRAMEASESARRAGGGA